MRRIALVVLLVAAAYSAAQETPFKVLFLGDKGHHQPADRFRQLQPIMARRGIDIRYTDQVSALNPATLAKYDGLILYANIDAISPDQESALLEFVAGGKGLIALHCASYCFRNSEKFVSLVGAQFMRHGTGTFRSTVAGANHPLVQGYRGFESWDETYVHTKHNEVDRTVLEYRIDGDRKEPWTWVRTHRKGRVFYTAWGHDDRTWSHPGFHNLVERGIRWACGRDPGSVPAYVDRPEMTKPRQDVRPFEYVDAKVPFYPPSRQWGVTAAPINKMQKPLPSDESIKHFVTPVGFEVRLFVDETKLGGKPICMNWDERGRLWVALTYDYPNEKQPEGQGRDRIVVCEDQNGDGVCDKVTTFAEKLSIPTSILPFSGGVLVLQAPYTLFLKDTDGDGKADLKQVLFTGWGTGDTHAGPSNLRYGLDNWVYGIVGYSAFHGEVAGERFDFRQGLFRFQLEKSANDPHQLSVAKLEFLRSTSNNSWGVGISEEGFLFGSTANGCPTVFMPIPNRYYERVRGMSPSVLKNIAPDNHMEPITEKVRQVDFHGGFTAAAGHALYTARTYPKEYWNRIAFVCEPTGHLVAMFELTPYGADYRARYFGNLLASDDEWSAPIMAEVGPDGNVWVIDWYNFIVQHNPTPPGWRMGKGNAYETELRDKKHGRIYRVVPVDARIAKPITLDKNDSARLFEALASPNQFWRLTAQRLLCERSSLEDREPLRQILAAAHAKGDDEAVALAAIHAMAVLDAVETSRKPAEAATSGYVVDLLHHPSEAVRIAALRYLANHPTTTSELVDYSVRQFDRAGPALRLQMLLGIAEQPVNWDCAILLAQALHDASILGDPVLRDALTIASAAHAQQFLTIAALSDRPFPANAHAVLAAVSEHYGRGSGQAPSGLIVSLMEAEKETAETIIAGLAKGWRSGNKPALSERANVDLVRLFERLPSKSKGDLLKLGAAWSHNALLKKSSALVQTALEDALNEEKSEDDRLHAIQQATAFASNPEVVAKLLSVISPRRSPTFVSAAIEAIGASDSSAVPAALLSKFAGLPPAGRAAAIRVLLSRVESIHFLLDAVAAGKISAAELTLDQRQTLISHPNRGIAKRAATILAKSGGLPDPDRQKVFEQLLPMVKQGGDASAGKLVFKNNCAKCHRHSGEGEPIGPDLTGTAVHPREHILTDIIDPSRNLEANFRIYRIELKSGRSVNGMLVSESKTSVELVDAEAKRHTILRDDIEEMAASNKSLMPEGFEKTLKPGEIADLLAFLTQRGKFLPIPIDKVATVVSTRGMFNSEDSNIERMIFRDWTPKTFEGVPFVLVDPQGQKVRNAILLHSPNGAIPPRMPKSVTLPCNAPARRVHLLSGVSGWGFPLGEKGSVSMIVRLHYEDGKTEDHKLLNGEHFADYIRRVDVPGSKFAFALRGQQIRYLAIDPQRKAVISKIEFVKGTDETSPIVMAVTVEGE